MTTKDITKYDWVVSGWRSKIGNYSLSQYYGWIPDSTIDLRNECGVYSYKLHHSLIHSGRLEIKL